MQTLPQAQSLGNKLLAVADTMSQLHPYDSKSIQRGLALAHAGKVQLVSDTLAFVASQSTEGTWYRIEHKRCSCPASKARCAHRWAAALMALAQNELERERLETQADELADTRYYATMQDEDGNLIEGIAYEGDDTWVFCDSERGATLAVPLSAIHRHGKVLIADRQREADGQLWLRVAGPQYSAMTA